MKMSKEIPCVQGNNEDINKNPKTFSHSAVRFSLPCGEQLATQSKCGKKEGKKKKKCNNSSFDDISSLLDSLEDNLENI